MTITDRDIAGLCAGVYATPDAPAVAWDHYNGGLDTGVVWALKKIDGVHAMVFRGSVTVDDWIADAQAIALWNSDLQAKVHPGFNRRIDKVWQQVKAIIGNAPFIVAGHSLGAARAAILTAYAVVDNRAPIARIVFGEPKSGFSDLARIVAKATGRSYMTRSSDGHGHDMITDIPLTLHFQPYTRASGLITLPVTVPPYDGFDEFRFHHMPIYAAAAPEPVIV